MLDRHRHLAIAGAVAFGLVACSGGSSPQTSDTSTTLVTLPSASTTAPPAPGGTTTTAPSFLPGQVATTVTTAASAAGATTTAAGRVVSNPNDNVRLGDTGAGVKAIQTALIKQGYSVAVDGTFGQLTVKAVKAFQAKAGIAQDGVVGPVTWAKLQALPTATTAAKPTTTAAKPTTTVAKTTTTTAH